jgi:hypothetical protein
MAPMSDVTMLWRLWRSDFGHAMPSCQSTTWQN